VQFGFCGECFCCFACVITSLELPVFHHSLSPLGIPHRGFQEGIQTSNGQSSIMTYGRSVQYLLVHFYVFRFKPGPITTIDIIQAKAVAWHAPLSLAGSWVSLLMSYSVVASRHFSVSVAYCCSAFGTLLSEARGSNWGQPVKWWTQESYRTLVGAGTLDGKNIRCSF